MNRETKHGPRTDEQLGHETDAMLKGSPVPSHSREDVQQETLWEEEDSPAPDGTSADISRLAGTSSYPAR